MVTALNLHLTVRILIVTIAISWVLIPMLQQWRKGKLLIQQ